MSDGSRTNATYVHRNQASAFVSKYLTHVQQFVYTEDEGDETSSMKSGLLKHFQELFEQGIEHTEKVRIEIGAMNQVWSYSDFEPDRVNRELNRMFTLDKSTNEKESDAEQYYRLNELTDTASKDKGGGGLLFNIGKFGIGGGGSGEKKRSNKTDTTNTTNLRLSKADLEDRLAKYGVHGAWQEEKFQAKSFDVYRISDILDQMQTSITSTELRAEKKRGAIYRTIHALDTPVSFPVGLFPREIRMYASTHVAPPFNWLICNGSAVSREAYARLFQVIDTTYGAGDFFSTFNLPDLRGRFPLGLDREQQRTTFASRLGESGGAETHRLAIEELPSYWHDQGSLSIGGSGSHTHEIKNAELTYTKVDWQENPNRMLHLMLGNQSNLTGDGISRPVDISSPSTTFAMNSAGDHSHSLSGSTGVTGADREFFILNPFQTVLFIIYAGEI